MPPDPTYDARLYPPGRGVVRGVVAGIAVSVVACSALALLLLSSEHLASELVWLAAVLTIALATVVVGAGYRRAWRHHDLPAAAAMTAGLVAGAAVVAVGLLSAGGSFA